MTASDREQSRMRRRVSGAARHDDQASSGEEAEHRHRRRVAVGEQVRQVGEQTSSSDRRRPNTTSFQRNMLGKRVVGG